MGLLGGATSLVEMIVKKFGDDIDGATQELVRMGGFPEPVARRIATGELPMDAESVAKRAQDQGYDLTSRWYHGTNDNFNEFDPEKVGSAYGVDDQGFYFTSSEDEAIKWAENAPNASSPKAMETVLSMENPWLIDAPNGRSPVEYFESGEGVFNRGQNAAVDYGVDSGYDGMVIRGGEEDMAIAFDPSRIRSPNAAFDPEYTGGNIMGGLLAGGVGLGALGQSEDADAGFVTRGGRTLLEAWHGSPHKFDKFSMDQIGTGEGVQQYGHGLYFADDIDTAKGFQPRDPDHEEWMMGQYKAAEESGDIYMMDAWERAMMHDSPIELRASAADPNYDEYSQAAFAEVADALSANPGTGSLSRVEIDVAPDSLLDYDKPLKEQSELVQNFFAGREGITPDTNGRALSESLLKGREPGLSLKELSAIASREMNEAGIRGLQYQDWVNQAEGSNLRNYVIFDDSLINIAERGNATVPMLGATALGTAGLLAVPALMKDGVFQHGATSEPVVERKKPVRNQSGLLESVTDFGDEVFKSVRHAAGPLADVFMPYEGVNNYLKTVNDYDKQPTWWDRLGILDF